jgi:hypothetical protein
MSANENEIELLETLLDGELADEQADSLRKRIAVEPALAAQWNQLRLNRDARRQAWRTMEPDDAKVAALVSSVRAAVRKDEVWSRRSRALKYVSGLAACLAMGFIFGRFAPTGDDDAGNGVIFGTSRGTVQEVVDLPAHAVSGAGGYKVLLTDSNGNVLGEQRFPTFDEAREFTRDLGKMQRRNQSRNSDTKLIKGEF